MQDKLSQSNKIMILCFSYRKRTYYAIMLQLTKKNQSRLFSIIFKEVRNQKSQYQQSMRKVLVFVFIFLLIHQEVSQRTYGNPPLNYWRQSDDNPQIDWSKNYICNGDFQEPTLILGEVSHIYTKIQCWVGSKNQIQIIRSQAEEVRMGNQVLNLLPPKSRNEGYEQYMTLSEGLYELMMNYAPSKDANPKEAIFHIYWNGVQVLIVRPFQKQAEGISITVRAKEGQNVLELVDASTNQDNHGAVVDDIGLYAWKSNEITVKEIDAVGSGASVTASSWLNVAHMDPQLDADEGNTQNISPAWCPIRFTTLAGNWIQVSTGKIELWNSVTIQGRVDGDWKVTLFRLMYTMDGFTWQDFEGGRHFNGAIDRNTKVRHELKPFYALTVRLVPLAFKKAICLRWGATYLVFP